MIDKEPHCVKWAWSGGDACVRVVFAVHGAMKL